MEILQVFIISILSFEILSRPRFLHRCRKLLCHKGLEDETDIELSEREHWLQKHESSDNPGAAVQVVTDSKTEERMQISPESNDKQILITQEELEILEKGDYQKLQKEYDEIPDVDRSDLQLLEDISKSIPLQEPILILKMFLSEMIDYLKLKKNDLDEAKKNIFMFSLSMVLSEDIKIGKLSHTKHVLDPNYCRVKLSTTDPEICLALIIYLRFLNLQDYINIFQIIQKIVPIDIQFQKLNKKEVLQKPEIRKKTTLKLAKASLPIPNSYPAEKEHLWNEKLKTLLEEEYQNIKKKVDELSNVWKIDTAEWPEIMKESDLPHADTFLQQMIYELIENIVSNPTEPETDEQRLLSSLYRYFKLDAKTGDKRYTLLSLVKCDDSSENTKRHYPNCYIWNQILKDIGITSIIKIIEILNRILNAQ